MSNRMIVLIAVVFLCTLFAGCGQEDPLFAAVVNEP